MEKAEAALGNVAASLTAHPANPCRLCATAPEYRGTKLDTNIKKRV